MGRPKYVVLIALGLGGPATAATVLFDFDNAPLHSPRPLDLTAGGITAHLSATGQGFSIQRADALGFTPVGFSGYCIYPSSVFPADLHVACSRMLTDLSILYAPEEYGCDTSATMRVTAYKDGTYVGTNTAVADPPGTWPTATLSFSSAGGFNSVVVHYDAPPPFGCDWGPIFMADNMIVDAVPACPADIDGSGAVNITDFLALLGAWGPCPGCAADIDGDGSVGIIDFLALLAAWGACP